MTAALHLATEADLDRIVPMIAAFHADQKIDRSDDQRHAAIVPLLQGCPHGVAYLIGPVRSPVGYIVISFGWSIAFGGMDGFVDELYIRPAVRGRGMASEVLQTLPKALATAGLRALHLEVSRFNDDARRLYARAHFAERDNHVLMTRRFD